MKAARFVRYGAPEVVEIRRGGEARADFGGQFESLRYHEVVKLLIALERDETGAIVVECPSLPGCVSQGATEAEAVENIREAIKGCLAARVANSLPLSVEVREVEVEVA